VNGCYNFFYMIPIQLQLEDHLADHLPQLALYMGNQLLSGKFGIRYF